MFASERMLKLLSESDVWNCDGTFVSSPKLYQQTYIIHTFYKDECYPCIFVNLKNKDKYSYTKMLNIIKTTAKDKYNLDLNPKTFFVDFEKNIELNRIKFIIEVKIIFTTLAIN